MPNSDTADCAKTGGGEGVKWQGGGAAEDGVLVVIQHRVQILSPLRVHVTIKDDPMAAILLAPMITSADCSAIWVNQPT